MSGRSLEWNASAFHAKSSKANWTQKSRRTSQCETLSRSLRQRDWKENLDISFPKGWNSGLVRNPEIGWVCVCTCVWSQRWSFHLFSLFMSISRLGNEPLLSKSIIFCDRVPGDLHLCQWTHKHVVARLWFKSAALTCGSVACEATLNQSCKCSEMCLTWETQADFLVSKKLAIRQLNAWSHRILLFIAGRISLCVLAELRSVLESAWQWTPAQICSAGCISALQVRRHHHCLCPNNSNIWERIGHEYSQWTHPSSSSFRARLMCMKGISSLLSPDCPQRAGIQHIMPLSLIDKNGWAGTSKVQSLKGQTLPTQLCLAK